MNNIKIINIVNVACALLVVALFVIALPLGIRTFYDAQNMASWMPGSSRDFLIEQKLMIVILIVIISNLIIGLLQLSKKRRISYISLGTIAMMFLIYSLIIALLSPVTMNIAVAFVFAIFWLVINIYSYIVTKNHYAKIDKKSIRNQIITLIIVFLFAWLLF